MLNLLLFHYIPQLPIAVEAFDWPNRRLWSIFCCSLSLSPSEMINWSWTSVSWMKRWYYHPTERNSNWQGRINEKKYCGWNRGRERWRMGKNKSWISMNATMVESWAINLRLDSHCFKIHKDLEMMIDSEQYIYFSCLSPHREVKKASTAARFVHCRRGMSLNSTSQTFFIVHAQRTRPLPLPVLLLLSSELPRVLCFLHSQPSSNGWVIVYVISCLCNSHIGWISSCTSSQFSVII